MGKLFILDNGHGKNTAGKRSPVWKDGKQLFEYIFNRVVVLGIKAELLKLGIDGVILVPEDIDISLAERCTRANKIYKENKNAVLISVHANAGGGTGWECFTSKGKTKSDDYATVFYNQFKKDFPEWRMRTDNSDGDPDKESPLYILTNTSCPALLTENFFMDTETDCRFIMSDEGVKRIIQAHVEAIKTINKM